MSDPWALLERLESGTGHLDAELLEGLAAVPSDQLAERLERLGGHAGCDLAWVLASRGDARGLAELARAATRLATAWRALGYLTQLDALDLVAAGHQTPTYRRHAELVNLLGAEPAELEPLPERRVPWPDQPRPVAVWPYRFRFAGLPGGAALLAPTPARVDGGLSGLDDDDLLSLLIGRASLDRLSVLPPANVPAEQVTTLLRSRAYYWLTEPRLEAAWQVGARSLLVIAARARGRPGFLVGDPRGDLPIQWLAQPPDEPGFDASRAAWIWLGRLIQSHE